MAICNAAAKFALHRVKCERSLRIRKKFLWWSNSPKNSTNCAIKKRKQKRLLLIMYKNQADDEKCRIYCLVHNYSTHALCSAGLGLAGEEKIVCLCRWWKISRVSVCAEKSVFQIYGKKSLLTIYSRLRWLFLAFVSQVFGRRRKRGDFNGALKAKLMLSPPDIRTDSGKLFHFYNYPEESFFLVII